MNRIITQNGASIFNIDNARNISVVGKSICIFYPSTTEERRKYTVATYETEEDTQKHFEEFKTSLLKVGESFFDFSRENN